uniref:Uncharacterized protein n=1 Tax=Angiostrongylus cantonensis TaxID=6313 RepID=A0A0K0DK78_ANGCA
MCICTGGSVCESPHRPISSVAEDVPTRPEFRDSTSSMETFVTAQWDATSSSYAGVSCTADYLSIRSDPSWAQFRPTSV